MQVTFSKLVNVLKQRGLYVKDVTDGEEVPIDGILTAKYMSDLHKKIVIIDDDMMFKDCNWDAAVSFMFQEQSSNPVLRVVINLIGGGRPFQCVVVNNLEKAKEELKKLLSYP